VAVTGAVILATDGWYWLDPLVALVIAMVIVRDVKHEEDRGDQPEQAGCLGRASGGRLGLPDAVPGVVDADEPNDGDEQGHDRPSGADPE